MDGLGRGRGGAGGRCRLRPAPATARSDPPRPMDAPGARGRVTRHLYMPGGPKSRGGPGLWGAACGPGHGWPARSAPQRGCGATTWGVIARSVIAPAEKRPQSERGSELKRCSRSRKNQRALSRCFRVQISTISSGTNDPCAPHSHDGLGSSLASSSSSFRPCIDPNELTSRAAPRR